MEFDRAWAVAKGILQLGDLGETLERLKADKPCSLKTNFCHAVERTTSYQPLMASTENCIVQHLTHLAKYKECRNRPPTCCVMHNVKIRELRWDL